MKLIGRIGIVVLVLMTLVLLPVSAHEGREVGEYEIELGWQVEPAYTGQINGVEIDIILAANSEGFEGAEITLQAEAIFGPAKKVLNLAADPEQVGHYTATLIPTRPGDYTFRLFGTIGETPIDETFSAAEGQFSTVEPISDLQFPDLEVSLSDLQAQITDLQLQITALQETNSP